MGGAAGTSMFELFGVRRGACHDDVASPESHQSDRRLILASTEAAVPPPQPWPTAARLATEPYR